MACDPMHPHPSSMMAKGAPLGSVLDTTALLRTDPRLTLWGAGLLLWLHTSHGPWPLTLACSRPVSPWSVVGGQWGLLAGINGGAGRCRGHWHAHRPSRHRRPAGPLPGQDSRLIQIHILGFRVLTGRRAWRAGAPACHQGAAGAGYGHQSQCGFRWSSPDLATNVETTEQRTQVKRYSALVTRLPCALLALGIGPGILLGTRPSPIRSTQAALTPPRSGQLRQSPRVATVTVWGCRRRCTGGGKVQSERILWGHGKEPPFPWLRTEHVGLGEVAATSPPGGEQGCSREAGP